MQTTKFLSKVIGLYLVIVSVGVFSNYQQFSSYVNDLINNPPLLFVTGFFTLILGLLMVVSHNIWRWHWSVIVTLIAWLVLIKGISIIFYHPYIDNLSVLFINNINFAYGAAGFDLLLGLLLTYLGFRR